MPSAVKHNYQSAATRLVIILHENGRRMVWATAGERKEMEEEPKCFLYVQQDKASARRLVGPTDTVIIPQLCRRAQTLPVKVKHFM